MLGLRAAPLPAPTEGERRLYEIAGNRVECHDDALAFEPHRQDLIMALLLGGLLVLLGADESFEALRHLLAASGSMAPPLGGVSLTRCAGHALVGGTLVWLGASALFRAGWTTGFVLRPQQGELVVHNLVLGLFRVVQRSYSRDQLSGAGVQEGTRGGRPVEVHLVLSEELGGRQGADRAEPLLSLVPSIGRRAGLRSELELLASLLNRRLRRPKSAPEEEWVALLSIPPKRGLISGRFSRFQTTMIPRRAIPGEGAGEGPPASVLFRPERSPVLLPSQRRQQRRLRRGGARRAPGKARRDPRGRRSRRR